MKRIWVLTTVVGLLASGALTAHAGPRDKPVRRAVTLAYETPSAFYVGPCRDCPRVGARRDERYVTVEVTDDVSRSAHVDIAWDHTPGDGFKHHYFVVCGATAKPQRIPPGSELTVYPWAHPGPDCPGSFSTKGKVKITFSDRP